MRNRDQSDLWRGRGHGGNDIAGRVGRAVVHDDDVKLSRIALAQQRSERRGDRGLRVVGRHVDGDLHRARSSMKARIAAAISAGRSLRSIWKAGKARATDAIKPKSSRQLP